MTERELQSNVTRLAKQEGWLCFHVVDAKRSAPGYPDLTLARGSRLIFAELKSETGRLRPEQIDWLDTLAETGNEIYTWRPEDWPDRIIEALRGPLLA